MIPTYRNMDSYPFHRNQIPFPHYYHPSMEPFPPQMRTDSSKSPFPYEQPWPYASSYSHPMSPHFYYNHNNFPSYIPYAPHVPSPSPMYCSGACPSFFGPYFPQSHYTTMEVPRYEYDKYMPKDHHCCGCTNHVSNQKEDKTMKVEEHEPNVGKKENDDMVPIQFRNFPYPLVWIPPEYYGNKQMKNPTKAEIDEQDKMSHDKKPINSSSNVFRDGYEVSQKKETDNNVKEFENGTMDQKHQKEQLPFPFIWFPYYNKQEEGERTKRSSTQECVEDVSHKFKSFPVKSLIDDGVANKTKSNDVESRDTSASNDTKKVNGQRSIPVKQIESNHEKTDSKEIEKRENVTGKDSHSISKRRSASPPRGSKLPPVCLRVDPLPRKKNGNGSSRSPSPPASKERSKSTACETDKTSSGSMEDKTGSDSNINNAPKAGEEVEHKVKTIQVTQNMTNENKGANTPISDGGKKERRVLFDVDAAVLIQAVYRGYLVRKWEPLKKLKLIDEVSKEVSDVRDRIRAFEDSSDLQNVDKQKIAVGETIMRLLLKLDTLQGLHPSLRENRKSLARELVTLQERLDSITAKNSEKPIQEFDAKVPVEVSPLNVQNGEHNQEQEDRMASQKDSSEGISNERPQDQFHMKVDDGGSESQLHIDPASNEGIEPILLPNELVNAADALDSTSSLSDKTAVDCELKSEVIDIPIEVDKLDMNALKELPVGVIDEDIIDDSASEGLDSDIRAMKELPVGVLDEDAAAASEFGKYEETNISKSEVQAENDVFIEELPVGLLDEDGENSKAEKYLDETVKDTQLEQPLVEEKEEIKSSEESDGWVKIELQKEDDELKVEAPMSIEESRIGSDTKLPYQTSPDHGNDEACLEANDAANISLNEKEQEEKLAQQETQVDAELNGDMKLLEENEKLRKLMKELLEAGNEQLNVISNLTGRVKDLEKKLAKTRKSKRVRTKRYRSVISKMSCDNSSE